MLAAILVAVAACNLLLLGSYKVFHNDYFWFLPWNLFLAAVPLGFSWCLARVLNKKRWSDWLPLFLTAVWLLFLPNSFYVLSDIIHLKSMPDDQLMYQTALVGSFALTSFIFGLMSLSSVHQRLSQRVGKVFSGAIVAIVIAMCSFAIHLGRDLKWNSWDVALNSSGLVFDVSDRILHPASHPEMISTTASFTALIGGVYVVYYLVRRPD